MMSEAKKRDEVQLIVFKDNLAARHFNIPLSWLTRLGALFGCLLMISIISLCLAAKYYLYARHASPAKLEQLEKELSDLKFANNQLESKLANSKTLASSSSPEILSSSPTPIASVAITSQPPDAASLPFRVENPKAAWKGNLLQVKFNIQYVKGDGKSQQGKIIIIARGPSRTFTYPKGAHQEPQSPDDLSFNPENGEHFSVSRFRATQANLGPVSDHSLIQEVEILIFNTEKKLLTREILKSENFTLLPNATPTILSPSPLSSPNP